MNRASEREIGGCRRNHRLSKKLHVVISATAASTLSGDGTIADVAVEHYVLNIQQIRWPYHNLVFTQVLEFVEIVLITPLDPLEMA